MVSFVFSLRKQRQDHEPAFTVSKCSPFVCLSLFQPSSCQQPFPPQCQLPSRPLWALRTSQVREFAFGPLLIYLKNCTGFVLRWDVWLTGFNHSIATSTLMVPIFFWFPIFFHSLSCFFKCTNERLLEVCGCWVFSSCPSSSSSWIIVVQAILLCM